MNRANHVRPNDAPIYQKPRWWVVKYCSFIHAHVYGCFWVSLSAMFLVAAAASKLGLMKMTPPSDYEWNIVEHADSVHREMADFAMAQADELGGGAVAPLTQPSKRFGMTFMYQWDDSDAGVKPVKHSTGPAKAKAEAKADIFTPANLKRWCRLEGLLLSQDDYATHFCKRAGAGGPNATCAAPRLSVANFFYAHATHDALAYAAGAPDALSPAAAAGCPLLARGAVDARRAELFAVLEGNQTDAAHARARVFFGFFVDKGRSADSASKTRSVIEIGQPLRGFASEADRKTEQKNLYMQFYANVEAALWAEFGLVSSLFRSPYAARAVTEEGVDVIFFSFGIQQNEFPRVVKGDLMLAPVKDFARRSQVVSTA